MTTDKQPIPITLTLHVDAAAAVRAGKAKAGPHTLRLTDSDLAALTDDQRDTLARHVAGERDYAPPLTLHSDPIACADVPTLALLLDTRAAHVVQLAEKNLDREAQAVAFDVWIDGARALALADLVCLEVPPEHHAAWHSRGDYPVSTLTGRGEEVATHKRHESALRHEAAREAEREQDEQAARARRARRAPVLDLLGVIVPELAGLYREGRSRAPDVSRALRGWLRAQTGARGLPMGWRFGGVDDVDPISVPLDRAVRLWTAHGARLVWPDGVTVRVCVGWAYRPALEDEVGDGDDEICEQAAALVLTVGGESVTALVSSDSLPPDLPASDPLAVQRRILAAVRAADHEQAARVARAVVDGPTPDVAAVLAATRHPAVRDAMAQIWQTDELEGRGK